MAKNKVIFALFINGFSMNILKLINNIRDQRMEEKVVHKFSSIIFIGLCALLSSCDSCSDIEDYCEAKKEWLSQYIDIDCKVANKLTKHLQQEV